MENALQTSVIICAYTLERWENLKAAIASVKHQETPAGEIILVIDHNPALLEMARAQFTGLTVVESRGRRGLSGTRNTGVETASKDVVVFMDEDAVAEPDWLTRLLRGYQDERVIGVGGMVEANWLEKQPAWFPDEFNWVVGCSYKGGPETLIQERNMLGCNMSFRRTLYQSSGGFRDSLGRVGSKPTTSCDDTEFCIRLIRTFPQSQIWHVPEARVRHSVPASRASWQYFRIRCYAEGLAKAQVINFAGAGLGLAAERKYTTRTLPHGIIQGIGDVILKGDMSGLLRALAIVSGLVITAAGFIAGLVSARFQPAVDSLKNATGKGYIPR